MLTLLAAFAAFAIGPAFAAAAPIVEVKPIGGGKNDVDLRELRGEEDVNSVGYAIRSKSGSDTETITGFSLEKILIEGRVDIYTFSYVEVVRPSGGSVLLTRSQVRDDGAFPDGQPVVFDHGGSSGFLRPSLGSSDFNKSDFFSGSPLRVIAHEGKLIELEARASKDEVEVGEKVTFTATITQQAAGSSPEINWSFNDGNSAPGAKVTHTFQRPGSYNVAVSATTDDDRTGGSAMVSVRVGKAKKGGPDRDGGGKDKKKGAPDSGASDGTGGQDGGTGSSDSTGANPSASPSQVSPDSERAGGKTDDAPEPDSQGERITGELLSGDELKRAEVIDDPAAAQKEQEEAPAPTLRTGTPSEESGFTVPGAALAGVGALGLVGLGALAEMGALAGAGAAMRRRFGGIRAKMGA